MTTSDDRVQRVIELCRQFATFADLLELPRARSFYEARIEELQAGPGPFQRRAIYRTIYKATNTGAGGFSDKYITDGDGNGDVEQTRAYYQCLNALLKATYTFP